VDDPMMDEITRMMRRIARLEKDNRRCKRVHAVLLVGMAVLLFGVMNQPVALEAQQIDRQEEALNTSEPLAEAQIKLALKALNSINHRSTSKGGFQFLPRNFATNLWSRRLVFAQLDRNDKTISPVDIFARHLDRMKELDDRAQANYRDRKISDLEQMETEFYRLSAETWLIRAKGGKLRLPLMIWW
jgi:hypothetical protein